MTNINPSLKSSELICRARGDEPAGVPAEQPGVCALCGCEIKQGDPQVPLSLGDSFMDDLYLAARGSQVVCGWCPITMTADGLKATSHGAFSLEGARPFRKWGDIAASLEDPPKPPFVMVYATANNQHMAWRAPVNWSRDMFYVRVGLRDLKIRRQALLSAAEDCALVAEAIDHLWEEKNPEKSKAAAAKPAKKTMPHPFITLSSDLKNVNHGQVKPSAFEAVAGNETAKAALDRLLALTLGETWALRFILTPNAGQAEPTE